MKVNRKFLQKVANKAAGLVMAERKVGGVTRREQLALTWGIAVGIIVVTEGLVDEGMEPLSAAAHVVGTALDAYPEHRDGMLSKRVADADSAIAMASVR